MAVMKICMYVAIRTPKPYISGFPWTGGQTGGPDGGNNASVTVAKCLRRVRINNGGEFP